jgi:hypothetical protein
MVEKVSELVAKLEFTIEKLKEEIAILQPAAAKNEKLKEELDKYRSRMHCSINVGHKLEVWGSFDAVKRVQTYILVDTAHAGENKSTNRQLMERVRELEMKLADYEVTDRLVSGELKFGIDGFNVNANYPAEDEINLAVDTFAAALKEKLLRAEEKYGWNGHWKRKGWSDNLNECLAEHIHKGDPLDVAAYCMFAYIHRWSVGPVPASKIDDAELDLIARDAVNILHDGTWRTQEQLHKVILEKLIQIRDISKEQVRCAGCGSDWTNDDVARERTKNKNLLACCPERKPLNIDQWRERSDRFEVRVEHLYAAGKDFMKRITLLEDEMKKNNISTKRGISAESVIRAMRKKLEDELHKARFGD